MKKITLTLITIMFFISGCVSNQATPVSDEVTSSLPSPTAVPAENQGVESNTSTSFSLTSSDLPADGRLPEEYTCDGAGSTLPLEWSGAPADTQSYAVVMHHVAAPDEIHWYWILYDIPATVNKLEKNTSGVGTLGSNINNNLAQYSPPCSKGPGDKTYIYTVYALSAQPQINLPAEQVNREVFLESIKNITLASAELSVVYARAGMVDPNSQSSKQPPSNQPPAKEPGSNPSNGQPTGYNIEQAISDKAQGMTISYDALAFLTGDLGADSFFPPGKVADFWGFQYLRDNDPSQMGHAGDFLTSAALNSLNSLTSGQRAQLVALAKSQVSQINEYGYKRFVLIDAFQRLLDGDLPAGTAGLDLEAVKSFSSDLYQLDGQISYDRAQLMGQIITSMTPSQLAYFDSMKGKGMLEWPVVTEPEDIRGLDRDVKVAVMTYAADLYSWYAGSIEADVYFCPERHGTYFGSFYLKDIKAMSDSSYAIPTNLTGDLGEMMLQKLTVEQAELVTSIVNLQKPSLEGIVSIREQISVELRKFMSGEVADKNLVLDLMGTYGAYDGEIIYMMATHFTEVGNSLGEAQKSDLEAMRQELLGELSHPDGAFLYSQAIPMPSIPNTDFLFK
jgi:phosphatidylethanolamine-binding protein (PEBP) family uncharacterized protein